MFLFQHAGLVQDMLTILKGMSMFCSLGSWVNYVAVTEDVANILEIYYVIL